MTGEIKITPNSNSSSSFSPVIYLINLFFENIKKAAEIMPSEKSKTEPVFTKTTKPNSTKPNTNNPNLSLDIKLPPELLNFF
jgi:hypothetical protein